MTTNHPLVEVIEANRPFWGAEAEVCRAYFESPTRDAASDRRWLARQAAKELHDGVVPRLERVRRLVDVGDTPPGDPDARALDPVVLEREAEELHEEAAHLTAFLAAHDALGAPGDAPVSAGALAELVAWPANLGLRDLRSAHRRDHGEVGDRAALFTEGGCGTLYLEGVRRRGRGGADDVVAGACAVVLEDEYEHMLTGIADLRDAPFGDHGWDRFVEITVVQSRQRILMRHEQFEAPVDPRRLEDLLAGEGEPLPFDWERAGLADLRAGLAEPGSAAERR